MALSLFALIPVIWLTTLLELNKYFAQNFVPLQSCVKDYANYSLRNVKVNHDGASTRMCNNREIFWRNDYKDFGAVSDQHPAICQVWRKFHSDKIVDKKWSCHE